MSALLALGAQIAPNAEAMDQGFYVGGFYGTAERDGDDFEDLVSLGGAAVATYNLYGYDVLELSGPHLSQRDDAYGFIAGFRWLPTLAFEFGYLQLGESRYRSSEVVEDQLEEDRVVSGSSRVTAEYSGLTLSALGVWPISYHWELYARGGVVVSEVKLRSSIAEPENAYRARANQDDVDFLAGVGISYTFLDVYTLRADYQRIFEAGDESIMPTADLDLVSLGIVVTF